MLQQPLHLLILILKGKNTGSLLLALTICGLASHSWLFIEMQLNGAALNKFTLVKIDRNTRKINNNKNVKVKVDTGAEVNVMRMRVFKHIEDVHVKMERIKTKLCGYSGTNITVEGNIQLI